MPSKKRPETGSGQDTLALQASEAPHPALIEVAKYLGRVTARAAYEARPDLPLDENPKLAREIMMITFEALFLSGSQRPRHKKSRRELASLAEHRS